MLKSGNNLILAQKDLLLPKIPSGVISIYDNSNKKLVGVINGNSEDKAVRGYRISGNVFDVSKLEYI